MTSDQRIWQRIHIAFEAHRQQPHDVDAQTAFERVAQKTLGLAKRKVFNSDSCRVHEEDLLLTDLHDLRLYHTRQNPQRSDGPIVIIDTGNDRVVVDGNNRVNTWIAKETPGPFDAIIVTPQS